MFGIVKRTSASYLASRTMPTVRLERLCLAYEHHVQPQQKVYHHLMSQQAHCPLGCVQGSKCHHPEPRCFFHSLEKKGGKCFQSITNSVIKLLYYTTQ